MNYQITMRKSPAIDDHERKRRLAAAHAVLVGKKKAGSESSDQEVTPEPATNQVTEVTQHREFTTK